MSDDATRSQIRGSSLLLAGQGLTMVVNLVAQVLIARHLSKGDFGAFSYALSIVVLCEMIAALGLRRGVSRFLPIYEERGEIEKAMGTLIFALNVVIWLGLAVVLVVLGLRGVIAGSVGDAADAKALLAILILLAPIQALEALLDGVFAVFARPRAILMRRHVYTPLMRLAVVGLLVAGEHDARFLAEGYVITGVVGLAIYGAMLGPVLRSRGFLAPFRERRLVFPVREVLGFTLPLLSNDVTAALLSTAGTILLGVIAGAAEVADLRVVMPISVTMTYVLHAFGMLFVPLAARMYARGEGDQINRLYWQTAAWSAVLALPIFLVAFAFGEQLTVLLFGERYAGSGDVLAALVVGHFLTTALGPNGTLLGVYGEVRYILATNVLSVAVNLALSAALIAATGALGAAIAASGTQIVLNVVRQFGLAKRTDVHVLDPQYIALYAVIAAAVGVVTAIGLALSPPLGVGIAIVAIASAAVLLFARERLDFAATFPELARLPVVGRFLA